MSLRDAIESLVDYACGSGMLEQADRRWAYNAVLSAIGAEGPGPLEAWELQAAKPPQDFDLASTLALLANQASTHGRFEDTASGHDRAAMEVMGSLMPRPSEIARKFSELQKTAGPEAATTWFYQLCGDADYVRRSAIARNIEWTTQTRWGDLEITINLSKPEKDPRDIAAAGAAKKSNTGSDEVYPACQLCMGNEGYAGRAAVSHAGAHPARQNLRIVPVELGGEAWGLQYSPYAYFSEHCIAMSPEHRPMHVDRENMERLLDFIDAFPHYFVGSNADLPIVGGSILSHDHFQGGRHVFPMMRAEVTDTFSIPGFSGVEGEVLNWPMTVLRLRSSDRAVLLDAADHVLVRWRAWDDAEAGVVSHDADGTRHNTITPVATKSGSDYVLYLALRCNITTDEHPLGVFHPHAEYHHIKKENIGLIEVMGLAILPPRLVDELDAVKRHLIAAQGATQDQPMELDALEQALRSDALSAPHARWALEVAKRHPSLGVDAETILHDEVGFVFGQVLEDAGVFKWDEVGRAALAHFLEAL
ncbi:UDP-glucose--hexose-1-phosphate uridylyltransferase [Collinsella sp. AGMB00827]|uniref:Galactose-1-phosphate uridylyltransferase n=1 Tax=Collinsella ureilytica TaxID=2869515 RepID=A0ABS7MK63_9ACTN|nr:UDP-glucose--hexose-1-phosphate uridylyltransferase [Collinsella urealyticum]MBY4797466.1 UDP-glucose--hexose-1-phosphate uridylyltransferase [Collinsella urealyticum]